jgi:acyl phosphate:glycerol-3-phosphate acyltransferase
MEQLPLLLLCAVVGYLLGSISTGILYSRLLGSDIRRHGSKNPGASNMLRTYGTHAGTITFVFDCAKAVASVLLGRLIAGQSGAMTAGFFAIIGHNWPLYFGFKGGKGIACCTGVFVFVFPALGIPAVLLDILTIVLTKYISLGSMVLVISYAIMVSFFRGICPSGVWAIVLALIAIWRHWGNLQRLKNGTERKIGQQEHR